MSRRNCSESSSSRRYYYNYGARSRSRVGEISGLSAQTLSLIQSSLCRRRFRDPSTRYVIHDNNSPGYQWLLPGWLAEERHMSHGRIYRYYYDPSGQMYSTRQEVVLAWEESGLIVIEDDD